MKQYSYTKLLGINLMIAGCFWAVSNFDRHLEDASINPLPENATVTESEDASADVVSDVPDTPEEKAPSVFTATTDYFDDALFIGDSRTVGLSEYGDLGNADVFASSGMSVFKVFDTELPVGSGRKTTLESLLQENQYGKIYIMLGINELGYPFESIMAKYKSLIETIRTQEPSALLFLGANMHVTGEKSAENATYSNAQINRLNQAIAALADDKMIFYIDVNEVFDDSEGNLDRKYTIDNSHVLGKYYADWVNWLLDQARQD